jgi:two-component sensor histidine kinase
MPKMGGIELLSNMRKMDMDIKMIFVTGYGELDTAVNSLRLGASDYLLKPCEAEELFDSINRCLGNGKYIEVEKNKIDESYQLKESSHRIKNNLAAIASLVSLYQNEIDDDGVIDFLDMLKVRIDAVAIIHDHLNSFNGNKFNIEEYFQKLCTHLISTLQMPSCRIIFDLNIDSLPVLNTAIIPLGLIVSELLSNSLKHAFSNKREGNIHISLKKVKDLVVLFYTDDGNGFPEEFSLEDSGSFGLKLITILADQLDGNLEIKFHENPQFQFQFHTRNILEKENTK